MRLSYNYLNKCFLNIAQTVYLILYIRNLCIYIFYNNTDVPFGYSVNICVIVGYLKFIFSNPLRTPAPTMRTDLDIGAEKSETTTVSDFILPFLK